MRIGILSSGLGWHVQDLIRAAHERGHEPTCVNYREITNGIPYSRDYDGIQAPDPHPNPPPLGEGTNSVSFQAFSPPPSGGRLGGGKISQPSVVTTLQRFDGLILRTMPAGSLEQIIFRMDALQAELHRGTRIINPPLAMETCIDKYLCTMRLQHAGLPVPRTIVTQTADNAMSAFETLGRDVVVKPIFGSEGRGMVRITDSEIAWRTFHTLEQTQSVLYLQEYVRHPGWDVRAFVIAGKVVACMKRLAQGDWRTNVAQGGRVESAQLLDVENHLAISAAKATGAIVAGVDLILDERGKWQILEVNAAPGWKALATVCHTDIAGRIVDHLQEWPA